MSTYETEIRLLAQRLLGETREATSGGNASQTLTVSAPGTGKAIIILGATVWYSDGSAHDATVDYTDRAGSARSQTMRTGGGTQSDASRPFPSGAAPIVTQENTSVSISAPASGTANETSTARIHFAVVDEEDLANVEAQVGD